MVGVRGVGGCGGRSGALAYGMLNGKFASYFRRARYAGCCPSVGAVGVVCHGCVLVVVVLVVVVVVVVVVASVVVVVVIVLAFVVVVLVVVVLVVVEVVVGVL